MPVVLNSSVDAEHGLVVAEVGYGHGGYRTVELDALVSWNLVRSLEALALCDCPRVIVQMARVIVLDSATLWALVDTLEEAAAAFGGR